MRRPILFAAIAAMTLATASASFAQSRQQPAPVRECAGTPGSRQPECPPLPAGKPGQQGRMPHSGARPDAPRGQHQAQPAAPPRDQWTAARHQAPRVGTSAKGTQPFLRATDSRFKPPPRGQDYRVVDGHLVLVDSQTLRIVSVVGLLAALMR